MPVLAKAARWTIIVGALIAYPVLAHYSATAPMATEWPALGLAVSLTPPLALLLWLGWRSLRWPTLIVACLGVGALLWACWPMLERNFSWVYFLQHAGTNAALALAFGLTLGRGRQPLVSRLAESVRGGLSPTVAHYTRQVTLAWSVFFVAVALLSTLLFLFAPIAVWSLFANFLTLPLAVLMFVVEYLIRLRRLPDEKQHRFLDSVRAYWKTSGTTAEASHRGR